MENEGRLVELGAAVIAIYTDGIAKVEINGPNFRVTFFEWRTIDDERVKVPVAEIIQPIANYRPLRLEAMIAAAQAAATAKQGALIN